MTKTLKKKTTKNKKKKKQQQKKKKKKKTEDANFQSHKILTWLYKMYVSLDWTPVLCWNNAVIIIMLINTWEYEVKETLKHAPTAEFIWWKNEHFLQVATNNCRIHLMKKLAFFTICYDNSSTAEFIWWKNKHF